MITATATLTPATCFDDAAFCAWWDAVESVHCYGWDDDDMLDVLINLYKDGTAPSAAADQALEAYEIGIAEAWMAIPSWA